MNDFPVGNSERRNPLSVPTANRSFNRVQKIWRPTPEYFNSPWEYFVRFINICQKRNAQFITMSQAIEKDFDPEAINVLLDHHIDYYPIETQVMCQWELDNGIVSNIYLFNESPYLDTAQRKIWSIDDLDIPFYQKLEKNGFEIGYHQNAVGITRVRNGELGRGYNNILDIDLIKDSQKQFVKDVISLRRYFDIRTFIPHGAGEGNSSLIDTPEGYEDLVWVYNNARKNKTVETPIKWKNYSDSCGQSPQRIRSINGQYVVRRNNLLMAAWLLETGLNHVLVHAGRYGKGMPYELYEGEPYDPQFIAISTEWIVDSQSPRPPFTTANLTRTNHIENELGEPRITDSWEVLRDWLYEFPNETPVLLFHQILSMEERGVVAVERPINRDFICPPQLSATNETGEFSKEDFLKDYEKFFNVLYTDEIVLHLEKMAFIPAEICLNYLDLESSKTIYYLLNLLKKYNGKNKVCIRIQCHSSKSKNRLKKLNAALKKESGLSFYTCSLDNKLSHERTVEMMIESIVSSDK